MKRFTSLLFLVFACTLSYAQINKGQFLAGGKISFESLKNEGESGANYKTNNFYFSPNVGYFIMPKLAAGARLNIAWYKTTTAFVNKVTSISLAPFVRYYFLPPDNKLNLLLDVSYINISTKYKDINVSASSPKSNGYNLTGGPVFFLNEHVGLEFLVSYQKVMQPFNYSSTSITTGFGLQIHLGAIKKKSAKV